MAKRRRRSGKRDVSFIPRSADLRWPGVRRPLRLSPLLPVEDRRRYHPLREFRPAHVLGGRSASRVVLDRPRTRPFSFPDVLRFAIPKKVALCIRRKERRETLFAMKRTRSGAGRPKRRNYWSAIKC